MLHKPEECKPVKKPDTYKGQDKLQLQEALTAVMDNEESVE